METASPIEIYIHIPFCVKKCAYCDFLSGPQDEETIEQYVLSLLDEIRAHGSNQELIASHEVTTIFFWWGDTICITNVTNRTSDESVA